MSKLAVLLCIIFVASVHDDAQAGFIEDGLAKVGELIDKKLEEAERKVAKAKEETQQLTEKVEDVFQNFTENVANTVTGILDTIDAKVLELIGSSNDSSVSDCAKLAEALHNTTQEKVANVAQCAIDRVGQSNEYFQSISSLSEELIHELRELKTELEDCARNVTDFRGLVTAARCGKKVAFKAGGPKITKVAVIFLHVFNFEMFVTTLPLSLPFCAVANGIGAISRNADNIFERVKQCVDENVNRPGASSSPPPTVVNS